MSDQSFKNEKQVIKRRSLKGFNLNSFGCNPDSEYAFVKRTTTKWLNMFCCIKMMNKSEFRYPNKSLLKYLSPLSQVINTMTPDVSSLARRIAAEAAPPLLMPANIPSTFAS